MNVYSVCRYVAFASLATTILFCFAAVARGQEIQTWQVLHGSHRCDHVIAQVMRHGVNQSVDRSAGVGFTVATPNGFATTPTSEIGDLDIVSVHRCDTADGSVAPQFAVVVMNQSQREISDVEVSLVALLGQIHPHCPTATSFSTPIPPCTAAEVIVTLPVEALSMGNRFGSVVGFQSLVVCIDGHDEWVETNEANNILAIGVGDIPVAAPAPSAGADASPVMKLPTMEFSGDELPTIAPGTVEPIGSGQVGQNPAGVMPTLDGATAVAPNGDTDADSLRMAVEKLGVADADAASRPF
ncbi:hypothetical protein [Rubripirellula lacrimiformis]|nr:hypothetical protein [Rubripirellula lacrimiformis]